MVETHFTLVRHGETEWNAQGILQGHGDPPLNELGRAQAARVAARLQALPFDAVVSSDLCRAMQTAEIIVATRGGGEILAEPRLRERALGRFEGMTLAQVRAAWPEDFALWARDTSSAPPGGERLDEMAKRVLACLQELAERHRGGRLLVVAHGGPIKSVVCEALATPAIMQRRMWSGNCSITRVKLGGEGLVVLTVNDLCHLGPEAEEA